jgi:hypothetical protein
LFADVRKKQTETASDFEFLIIQYFKICNETRSRQ